MVLHFNMEATTWWYSYWAVITTSSFSLLNPLCAFSFWKGVKFFLLLMIGVGFVVALSSEYKVFSKFAMPPPMFTSYVYTPDWQLSFPHGHWIELLHAIIKIEFVLIWFLLLLRPVFSRCSAARLAHHVRDVEAGGSNPLISTF